MLQPIQLLKMCHKIKILNLIILSLHLYKLYITLKNNKFIFFSNNS